MKVEITRTCDGTVTVEAKSKDEAVVKVRAQLDEASGWYTDDCEMGEAWWGEFFGKGLKIGGSESIVAETIKEE